MTTEIMHTAWQDYYKGIKTLSQKNTQKNYINYLENLVNLIKTDPSIKIRKGNQKSCFSGECLKIENSREDLGCIVTVPMSEKLENPEIANQIKSIIQKNGKVILSNYYEFRLLKNNAEAKTAILTNPVELDDKNSELSLLNMEEVNNLFDELLAH